MGADDGGLGPKALGQQFIDTKSSVEGGPPLGTPDSPGSIPNVGDSPASSDEEVKRFSPPGVKLTIGSLDDETLTVSAQYNPRELQVDRVIPWQARMSPEVDRLTLEYTGEEGRSLSLELLFDGYEENLSIRDEIDKLEVMSRANIDADPRQRFVSTYDKEQKKMVTKDSLDSMSEEEKGEYVVSGHWKADEKLKAKDEKLKKQGKNAKRPHLCVVAWGEEWLPAPLMCVIDGIRTRYSMFSDAGVPLRATVTLALKEAHNIGIASEQDRQSFAARFRNQRVDEYSELNRTRLENEKATEGRNAFQTPTPLAPARMQQLAAPAPASPPSSPLPSSPGLR